jgi:tetratricopeptide (TPR) repeat protein
MEANRKQRRALAHPAGKPGRGGVDMNDPASIASHAARKLAAGEAVAALTMLALGARRFPTHPELGNNHANALAGLGRFAEAAAVFETVLALRPAFPEALNNFGSVLEKLGRLDEAAARLRAAIALAPGLAAAHNNLAGVLKTLGDAAGAEASYRRAIALDPNAASPRFNFGTFLIEQNREAEAVSCLERVQASNPDNIPVLNNLGVALKTLGRLAEAERHLCRALSLAPDYADTHHNLGTLRHAEGALAAARDCYRRALDLRPDMANTWCNLGSTLAALGDLEGGRAALRRAIALAPLVPIYHRYLADIITFTAGDADDRALAALAARLDHFPPASRLDAHFALAKAASDGRRHDAAMAHYLAGNALKRRLVTYDEAAELAALAAIPERFPAPLVRGPGGDPDRLPIFIVGMPRSGTTLVEQVLASVPGVFGGDEMDALDKTLARFPAPETLDEAGFRALAADYLARIRALAPGATRITNKVPLNFRHLGLLHRALPAAKFVHVFRDPLDTCVSCFTKLFSGALDFTYDLGELGRYWRAYERVMAHWRAVLPAGVMLDLRYEDFVADFATEARRLVAFCGLDWDEGCLRFFETSRAVRTASVAQVRNPLFATSIGRWQVYGAALAPLQAALAEAA